MLLRAPKGTRDILPGDIHRWHYMESVVRDICRVFGYHEIRTPVFEHTELFSRGVGETTDVVQKEMYTFQDKADRSLTLRPEGTAGVVRAFIENGMTSSALPQKMYYYGPMFRYENVQHGRYREFWQFGCEVLGAEAPGADVEIISLLKMYFERLGLTKTDLRINSIGCQACRPAYHELLHGYLAARLDRLCPDCRDRFERNPLRVLDCKQERCAAEIAGAPKTIDHICDSCASHFEGLKAGLSELGIDYTIDKSIVRGLDYYTRTVFEYVSDSFKSLGSTICGGGRYDGLVEVCGGARTSGVGFSIGIERLFIELDNYNAEFPRPGVPDVFIITAGEAARSYAGQLANRLRRAGIAAETDLNSRSVKAQMKYADKRGAAFTAVIGDDELAAGKAVLRNMADGSTAEVPLDGFAEWLKNAKKI